MWRHLPHLYPLLGLCGGYAIVMIFNPVRSALADGFRCIRRYKRVWIAFALLGFGYFLFQFVTFTPIRHWADLDLNQIISYAVFCLKKKKQESQEALLQRTRMRFR